VPSDPFLGHAVFVGVWDVHRRISDVSITSKQLNNLRITESKWAQSQSFSFNLWLGHWVNELNANC
jgi:hypothetical protein